MLDHWIELDDNTWGDRIRQSTLIKLFNTLGTRWVQKTSCTVVSVIPFFQQTQHTWLLVLQSPLQYLPYKVRHKKTNLPHNSPSLLDKLDALEQEILVRFHLPKPCKLHRYTYMYPAQCNKVMRILQFKQFFLIQSGAWIWCSSLLWNHQMSDAEHIVLLEMIQVNVFFSQWKPVTLSGRTTAKYGIM